MKRLADVRRLRAAQFPEDDGPLAHPVRPDSYIAIDNFYTATVYQKGAEVVRMMHTEAGAAAFRRGMDCYFDRHDNQAVTIEDFVAALSDGSGVDLTPFLAWYAQAGTPEITVSDRFDAAAGRYTLTLRQQTRPTPGQPGKVPVPVPVAMALLAPDGRELPGTARVLLLREAEQDFVFEGLAAPPVPSLLRGFSAPVRLAGIGRERLRFLAAHDTDAFVRWDSLQAYATGLMLDMVARWDGTAPPLDPGLLAALTATLAGADADPAFAAEALVLPSESYVADQMPVAAPDAIHAVRQALRAEIGAALAAPLRETYARLADPGPHRIDGAAMGRRALRNVCLAYLAAAEPEALRLARAQFDAQANMTDVLAALDVLAASDAPDRDGGAGGVPRPLAGRRPRARQVVRDPGGLAAARHDRRGAGAVSAPGLRPAQPEPRARPGRRLRRRQPGALPRRERRRLSLPRRRDHHARPAERADRGAHGQPARRLAAAGGGARRADAGRAGADPGDAAPVARHVREGVEGARMSAGGTGRW